MGRIYLSCGHEDHKKHLGWPLYTLDYASDGGRCIIFGTYCTACLRKKVTFIPELVFFTNEEAWLALEEESGNG